MEPSFSDADHRRVKMMRLVEQEEIEPLGKTHLSEGRVKGSPSQLRGCQGSDALDEAPAQRAQPLDNLVEGQARPLRPLRIFLGTIPAKLGPILGEQALKAVEEYRVVPGEVRQILTSRPVVDSASSCVSSRASTGVGALILVSLPTSCLPRRLRPSGKRRECDSQDRECDSQDKDE